MRKIITALLCATLATLGAAAALSMPTTHKPLIAKAAEPVVCVGDRRNYRDFSHCWAVNIKRLTPRVASQYCSRICR
jgi:hypothetical protein